MLLCLRCDIVIFRHVNRFSYLHTSSSSLCKHPSHLVVSNLCMAQNDILCSKLSLRINSLTRSATCLHWSIKLSRAPNMWCTFGREPLRLTLQAQDIGSLEIKTKTTVQQQNIKPSTSTIDRQRKSQTNAAFQQEGRLPIPWAGPSLSASD